MRHLIIIAIGIIVSSSVCAAAEDESQFDCYLFGKAELTDSKAPSFNAYKVAEEPAFVAAPLNLKSNPIARSYKTALRRGIQSGPNFAGHYALVVWGCGSSCADFAVVDLKNGSAINIPGVTSISGVRLNADADEFLKEGYHDVWGFRYKLSSNLLVLVGTINEDNSRQGAFYYALSGNVFKLIHTTSFHTKCKG